MDKLYAKFYRVQVRMKNNATLVDCVKVYNMINSLETLVCALKNELGEEEENTVVTEIFNPLAEALEDFTPCK